MAHRRKPAIAALVTLGIAAAVVVPAAVSAQAAPSEGAILFEEDFTGPAGSLPDQSKWYDWSTATYNSSAAYGNIKPGDNEVLNGAGNLVIPATPTAGSAIRTRFSFQYGTMSAWIKTTAEKGYWPAFWSLNNNPNGVEAPTVGEVDALEAYTTWDDSYHSVSHSWTNNGAPGYHSVDTRCASAATVNLSADSTSTRRPSSPARSPTRSTTSPAAPRT